MRSKFVELKIILDEDLRQVNDTESGNMEDVVKLNKPLEEVNMKTLSYLWDNPLILHFESTKSYI